MSDTGTRMGYVVRVHDRLETRPAVILMDNNPVCHLYMYLESEFIG